MKKILIVDDEILVRMGLRSLIDWEAHGYTVVGDAADGAEALEKIKRFSPDLVFTDLKMDGMDGLELIKSCARQYPEIKLVVLSSYNDAENVRRAMKLGAIDYVFKLEVKDTQLVRLLEEITWEEAPAQVLSNNLRALKTGLIRRAVFREYGDAAAFPKEFAALGLKTDWCKPYCLMTVSIDNFDALRRGGTGVDTGSAIQGVENMAVQVMEGLPGMELYPFDPSCLIAVLPIKQEDYAQHMALLQKQYATLYDYVKRYLELTVTAVICGPANGIESLPDAYRRNEETLSSRYLLQSGRIHGYHEAVPAEDGGLPDYLAPSRFESALKCKEEQDAADYLETFFAYLSKRRAFTLIKIRAHLMTLYSMLRRRIEEECPELTEWKNERGLTLYQAIELCDRLSDVQAAMEACLKEYWQKGMGHRCRREIVTIKSYALSHLQEDLSVASAARLVNMSESYFSHVFKKETQVSFVDWLNRARIQEAARLLTTTDEKIGGIAAKVGIENPNYFSILFKKITGMAPMDMRQRGRGQHYDTP